MRLQWVWWGLLCRPTAWFIRDGHGLGRIYRWRCRVGPVEVRKWA